MEAVRTLTVALVGEESAAARTLRLLTASDHHVAAVLTSGTGAGSAGSLRRVAGEAGLTVLPAERVREPALAGELRALGVDLLLNVHSLCVAHPEVLRAPGIGCFNLHPGPLPAYAGLNPVSWALYRGATTYGVTVHHMVERIDAGGIAYEESFPVSSTDTAFTLYAKCIRAGVPLVSELLETAARHGTVPSRPQDLSRREYFGAEVPDGGRIRWDRPARAICDFVRACDYGPFPSPWGHPRARVEGEEVALLAVAATDRGADAPSGSLRREPDGRYLVACADRWIELKTLQVEGRKRRPEEIFGSRPPPVSSPARPSSGSPR